MGVTTNAYLYIGVTLDKICSIEEDVQTYDKHDEKTGQKTGEKIVEKNYYLHTLGKDRELMNVDRNGNPIIYSDTFDLDVFDEICPIDPNRDNNSVDDYFVGIRVCSCDNDCPSINFTSVGNLMEIQAQATDLLHKEFGYKGGVEVILQHYISC